MIYDKIIHGKFVDMRSITLDDVEFSYNIRADEKYRDIVGKIAPTIDKQREFIMWQMAQPNDYYFVVLNKEGERIGLVGVYDIQGDIGEIGREVSYGNPMETMETQILLNDFCRDILKLKKICYVIYLNNKKNINIQKRNNKAPIKIIDRGGVKCAYYENEVSEGNEKIKKLLDRIRR